MGSKHRSSPAYRAAAQRFKTGNYPCVLANGPWCTGHGTTVDHHPPLGGRTEAQWMRDNRYTRADEGFYSACKPCQDHQGGRLAHHQPYATTRMHW